MALASQHEIESLAERIQTAYLRRGARWSESRSTSRVWAAAAAVLWQSSREAPGFPVDPELFVASQGLHNETPDPWIELASPQAGAKYRSQILRIIQQLRTELDRELQHAEQQVHKGRRLREIVCKPDLRLSPLGRYIFACRNLRRDLAIRWSRKALAQLESCPLYQNVCHGLLTTADYPIIADRLETAPPALKATATTPASLN